MRVRTAKIRSPYPNSTPPAAFLPPTADTHVDSFPSVATPDPTPAHYPDMVIPPKPTFSPCTFIPLLWRSTRSKHGTWTNTRYQYEVFYSSILDPSLSYQYGILSFCADIDTGFHTGLINGNNPHSYTDSHKNYPDNPYVMNIYMEMNLNTIL